MSASLIKLKQRRMHAIRDIYQHFLISNLWQFRGVSLSGEQRQAHPDDSVNDGGAPLVIDGGAEVAVGQLVDQVVDGLGVEKLLLGLHDALEALVAGHGMFLWSLANPSTHPVCLKIPGLNTFR